MDSNELFLMRSTMALYKAPGVVADASVGGGGGGLGDGCRTG